MTRQEYHKFWTEVVREWNARGDPRLKPGETHAYHLPLGIAGAVHYEWQLHMPTRTLDCALDFELQNDSAENLHRARMIWAHRQTIERGIEYPFCCGLFGDEWARARFIIPVPNIAGRETLIAAAAADTMKALTSRTQVLVERM